MESIGRYQIIEQIGAGAMGAVYKARDPMMDRDVAIKSIHTYAIEGPSAAEFRERFFREAQAAGRLAHPGIVTVFDVSEQDGAPFLVMEYVAGRTLQSILQDGERIEMDRSCDWSIQLAEALHYAHENGVVHRDIKPANILITKTDRAKIADFGVAKLIGSQVTSTGQLLGTPAFMAPEQFTGAQLDGRADIFALGVIIYWMATGDKPFTGDSILAVQYKVVHTDPVPPRKLNPAIPRELETIILKSIAKDPAERYSSGEELARDLRALRTMRITATMVAAANAGDSPTLMMTSLPADSSHRKTTTISHASTVHAPVSVTPPPEKQAKGRGILIGGLIALAIIFGLVEMARTLQDKEPSKTASSVPAPPPQTPAPPTSEKPAQAKTPAPAVRPPAPKATEGRDVPSSPPVSDAVTLDLTARDKTNVIFKTEGHPMETLIMTPGETASLHAEKEATLIISNAGVLEGKLNGKPVSFGDERRGAQFQVSAAGVVPLTTPPLTAVPGIDEIPGDRGGRGFIGSPARQKEMAQSPTAVRLLIKSPALAELLTVVVRIDNAVLFRRDATAAAQGAPEEVRRRQLGGVPTAPLAEERLIPPGTHTLQVTVLLGNTRLGQAQEVTSQFFAGQHRTLNIDFQREGPRAGERGAANRFTLTLD